jgi:hypothetical protein
VGVGTPYVLHTHTRPPLPISAYSIDRCGNLSARVGEETKEFGWREWRWILLPLGRKDVDETD